MRIKKLIHIDHFIITLLSFVQLYILGFFVYNFDFLNPIAKAIDNYSITDMFFEIEHSSNSPLTNDLITIVDMTELHDRSQIAYLLDEINLQQPLCIGVDIIFEGLKSDSLGSGLLANVANEISKKTVFGCKLINYRSDSACFTNNIASFFSEKTKLDEGFCNLTDNMQGACVREYSTRQNLNKNEIMSFPMAIANKINKNHLLNSNSNNLINYDNVKFPIVNYDEIGSKSDLLEGHIVLVGTTKEEQDMHNSPIGKMSGIEIQAYTLLTILNHENPIEAPLCINILLGFLLCYVIEIIIYSIELYISKHQGNIFMTFIRESNIPTALILFICMAFVSWITFLSFIKYNYILDGGLFLALMVLVCESRDFYHAIITSLCTKYQWSWLKKSIMNQ